MARPLLGFAARGEKEGEEEQRGAGKLFILQGGPGTRGSGGGGDTATALVAAVFPLSPQEEEADREGPLSVIYCFPSFYFSRKV